MELFVHKNRNVVVKQEDKGEHMKVAFVGVLETVQGAKRRGRHPNYEKLLLKPSELVPFEMNDVWRNRAVMALEESSDDEIGMGQEVDSEDAA